ncbi:MAG: DNA gyrase subunit A, partial [Alphaproteobacteria bacterium]|nr:DNA gyrase subunit A [Alphaproteobacteria bacterium]
QYVKGPDFPTGAKILGTKGIESAFHTGRGSVIICGTATIEEGKSRSTIIINSIPWQVNKNNLVDSISRIKDKSESKELDVISAVRDESDRFGVRIVVELKKDAEPEIVINYLQKYTQFQTSFGVNMLAIDNGVPKLLNLKDILVAFIEFRKVVVRRRTLYLLQKARDRAHLLAGLGISVENIDEVIELIKSSPNPAAAREQLMAKPWRAGSITPYIELLDEPDRKVVDGMYYLSETQARGILDLRLHRLTGLEREKIQSDLEELAVEIRGYLEILGSMARLMEIVKDELVAVRSFATPRKTQIEEVYDEFSEEDFIQKEEVTLTLTNSGYIKRMPITAYKTQKRGGKGKIGTNTKEEDVVTNILITNSHANILFFTDKGLAYQLKCYRIPESSTTAMGRAIVNLLPIEKNEKITAILPIEDTYDEEQDIVFITKSGNIRRSKLKDFSNINSKGKIAMKLDDGDSLVGVYLCNDDQDILISSHLGQCLRFPLETLRVIGSRNSTGVRAISLDKEDFVINVSILQHEKIESVEIREEYLKYANAKRKGEVAEVSLNKDVIDDLAVREEFILTVTSNGFGKRTSAYDYRITNRGGKGFLGGKLSDKNGYIVASFVVEDDDEIIIISNKGQVIRQNVKDIRITSRVATGVILFRLEDDEVVQSVSKVKLLEDIEETEVAVNSQEELI